MADKQNQQGAQGTTQGAQGQPRAGSETQNVPLQQTRTGDIARPSAFGSIMREPRGVASSPFALMRRLMNEMDSVFDDLGLSMLPFGQGIDQGLASRASSMGSRLWSPQIESFERGNQLVVRADLPGVALEDVTVSVDGDVLTLSGERRSEQEENSGGYYRSERTYGSFQRALRLPEGVDPNNVKASFDNGVLEITMNAPPRSATARTIEVTPGGGAATGSTASTRGSTGQKSGPAH